MGTPPLPWQPVARLDSPFREEIFPKIQLKPPWVLLEAVSSCPVLCSLGAEPNPTWLHPPVRELQRKKVPPSLLFSRPSAPQLPQLLLVLQPLPQLRSHPWTRSSPSVSFLWWRARPQQCPAQGTGAALGLWPHGSWSKPGAIATWADVQPLLPDAPRPLPGSLPSLSGKPKAKAPLWLAQPRSSRSALRLMMRLTLRAAIGEAPKVEVYARSRAEEGKQNTLHCFVTGFHPPKIDIELLKNGEPISGVMYGDLSFNEKWQFQRLVYVPFIPTRGDTFACRVAHSTMTEPRIYRWEPDF